MSNSDPLKKLYTAMMNLNNRLKHSHKMRDIALWVGCPMARYDNFMDIEGRVFAHTNHVYDVICIVEKASLLSYPYIYGILCHEIGHILAIKLWEDDRESAADEAAYCFLGMIIHYGDRNIQYISSESMASIHTIGAE